MNENRMERLAEDYRGMLAIQDRPYLSWVATKGELPYAEEYLLSIRLRTYALTATPESYCVGVIDRCTVKITLWDSYPMIAPNVKMLSLPPAFHPDWYSKGAYCPCEPWQPQESLKDYVLRMLSALQYPPDMPLSAAPANYKALSWYRKHRDNPAWFPSDATPLTENTPEELAAIERSAVSEIIDTWQIR